MTDYSQFEAGLKSGIHANPKRIQTKDEIIAPILRGTRRFLMVGLLFLMVGVGLALFFFYQTGARISYKNFVTSIILLFAALFCFWRFFSRKKMVNGDLREYYEEGLLVGGMIINTKPLTLMALASLVAYDGGPDRYGCYKLVMRELEGAKGELYEKIPCSCFFRYESGYYHDAFQPHPLYWGTTNLSEIAYALDLVERESVEDSQDTWGIIQRVAEQFPDLKDGQIVVLDENFQPMGIRYYWQTGLDPIDAEENRQDIVENNQKREYHKKPQEPVLDMRQDRPGREVYERFADLACRYGVYDYFTDHCTNKSVALSTHPGFFTCIGDPVTFPQELRERNISLQVGEYPLFLGNYLATTRGFYRKKEFISWYEAQITFKVSFVDAIKVYVNGKYCTQFGADLQGYKDWEQIPEEDKRKIADLEVKRLEEFFQYIKVNGI